MVIEYIKKYKDKPNRFIARAIVADHPEMITGKTEAHKIENARKTVRYYFNAAGKEVRKYKGMRFTKDKLPEADVHEWEPYKMKAKNILVLSDIHTPFHDPEAVTTAINYGLENKVTGVLLNGDIMDCYWLSRWSKDKSRIKKSGYEYELDVCRSLLTAIREAFPKAEIVYKEGNHEQRHKDWLNKNAPMLAGVAEITLPELLRLRELGITWVDDCRPILIGDLPILHGHEFGSSVFSPVNPARGYAIRANESMLAGHNHQTSEHSQKRKIKGQFYTTWSTGCLCQLRAHYAPMNNWNHGFARVEVTKNGYKVDNRKIANGEVV